MKGNSNKTLRSCLVSAACLAALAGCRAGTSVLEVHQDLIRKGLHGRSALKYLDPRHRGSIGDNYRIGGAELHKGVEGMGVVVGLDGTGDMKGLDINMRQEALKRLVRVEDPEFKSETGFRLNRRMATEWMNSGYVSLVLVRAVVGVGQRAGDRMDVLVSTLDGTQSLEGGYLFPTDLKPFATGLDPRNPAVKKYGPIFVEAAGPVVVRPVQERGSNVDLTHGLVEAGGEVVVKKDRLSVLAVMLPKRDARGAVFLEQMLNERFGGKAGRTASLEPVAKAVSSSRVSIRIPECYDADPLRFVEVLRRMPARLLKDSSAKSLARKYANYLASLDTRQRMLGALILEGLGAAHGTRELQAILQGGAALARIEAGRALYFLQHDDALEVAGELVLSGTPEERIEGLTLYTLFGRDAPVDVMRRALDVENAELAGVAAFALALCADTVPAGRRVPGRVVDLRIDTGGSFGIRRVSAAETYRVLWVPHAAEEAIVAVRMNEKRAIILLGECLIEGAFSVDFHRFTITSADRGRIEVRFEYEGEMQRRLWEAEATQLVARLEYLGLSWSDSVSVLKEIERQRAMTVAVSTVGLAGNRTEDRLVKALFPTDR